MSDKPDNPPAFPFTATDRSNMEMQTPGMTLHQWYVGMALMGICANPANATCSSEELAGLAVLAADAVVGELCPARAMGGADE